MKEYIKLFDTPADADSYLINDIPFISTVASTEQNLHCKEEGYMLETSGDSVSVVVVPKPLEMVDLGLPSGILWAKYNLGANPGSTPESYYGNYYAWGELETKENYTWDTYKFGKPELCDGSDFTKYNNTDGLTILQSEDDIVTVTYGSKYCMPTIVEFYELVSNTDKEWITDYNGISGLNGRKFMKKSDHSIFIFIPAAGAFFKTSIYSDGTYCYYWSSSLITWESSLQMASYYDADSVADALPDDGSRYGGCSIRPIKRQQQ